MATRLISPARRKSADERLRMLPQRAGLQAWTGFLDAYVHLADIFTRMNDLPRSLVALLIGEACNVGLTPVIKAGDEALTRGRPSHVDQNYVRAYGLLRMFVRQGSPTPLGQAFAEYGRIDKTTHLLSMLDPMPSTTEQRRPCSPHGRLRPASRR
ncbi:transposase [Streptosporangium sp. NBC_01639]|nr:transposase [Streptosporangium sp. NBC_01639]